MKKIFLLSAIFISVILSSFSQPIISQNDMPNIGDTIKLNVSSASALSGINYTASGSNIIWNFSSLTSSSQRADTFMTIQSTSTLTYYLFFYASTIVGTQPDLGSMNLGLLSLSITNVYDFFKNNSTSYSQLGYGAKFNGNAIPVQYNNPDIQLKFPLTYLEKDSCDFSDHITIPSLGYYGEKKHRINYVDGWGTIITPIDTFPAIRVLSKIYAHDTIHIDTLISYGTSFNDTVTEYKWYAYKMGEPVMKISIQKGGMSAGTTVEYQNRKRNTTGIKDIDDPLTFVGLYPNPVNENTNLYFSLAKQSEIDISITDLLGRNIKTISHKEYLAGFNSVPIDISGLGKGIYFVRTNSGNNSKVIKMEVF
jgi:hypothetical protein